MDEGYLKSSNSPTGGLFIFDIFGWGLIRGGRLYEGGGAYKIILEIKKILLKYLIYCSRNFFINIYLIINRSMNF